MRQTLFLLLVVGLGNSVLAQTPSETNGKAVFDKWCAPCHGAVAPKNVMFGTGALAGTSALAVKYKGKVPAVLEATHGSYAGADQNRGAARFVRHADYAQDGSQRRGTGRRSGVSYAESEEVTEAGAI